MPRPWSIHSGGKYANVDESEVNMGDVRKKLKKFARIEEDAELVFGWTASLIMAGEVLMTILYVVFGAFNWYEIQTRTSVFHGETGGVPKADEAGEFENAEAWMYVFATFVAIHGVMLISTAGMWIYTLFTDKDFSKFKSYAPIALGRSMLGVVMFSMLLAEAAKWGNHSFIVDPTTVALATAVPGDPAPTYSQDQIDAGILARENRSLATVDFSRTHTFSLIFFIIFLITAPATLAKIAKKGFDTKSGNEVESVAGDDTPADGSKVAGRYYEGY